MSAEVVSGQNPEVEEKKIKKYEDLYKELNKAPDEKQFEADKKKEKRNRLFAAIGDGISALSNLFFTTQGAPNMYTGKNTMSARSKVRYDKLIDDYEKNKRTYYAGLHNAMLADDRLSNDERNWQHQLAREKVADDRYKVEMDYRKERDKVTDDRYKAEMDYRKERDNEADEKWNKQMSYNYAILNERKQAEEARKNKARGKRLGFSDGKGNQVSIYENVWKGSMQQVYDALVDDKIGKGSFSDTLYNLQMGRKSNREKDDFVKQNWHKSEKAKQIMKQLSELDPATMDSNTDEGVEDWNPETEAGIYDWSPD